MLSDHCGLAARPVKSENPLSLNVFSIFVRGWPAGLLAGWPAERPKLLERKNCKKWCFEHCAVVHLRVCFFQDSNLRDFVSEAIMAWCATLMRELVCDPESISVRNLVY